MARLREAGSNHYYHSGGTGSVNVNWLYAPQGALKARKAQERILNPSLRLCAFAGKFRKFS